MNYNHYVNQAVDEINQETRFAYDVAAGLGQHFQNVKGTVWFLKAVADQIRSDEEAEMRFQRRRR